MRRINRRHTKLSRGYTTEVKSDGLVVAKPQRKGSGLVVRGFALMLITVILFKGFLHAQLGDQAYQARVTSLAEGNIVEQAGAWVMTADPVTLTLSSKFVSLVR